MYAVSEEYREAMHSFEIRFMENSDHLEKLYQCNNIAGSIPDFNIFLLRRLERALRAPKTSPRHYAAATRIKDVVQYPSGFQQMRMRTVEDL